MPAKKSAKNKPTAAKKAGKPKASDLIKQSSHTPAIFKTNVKRPANILFTLEEVREVLKKRAEEEAKASKTELECYLWLNSSSNDSAH